MKKLIYLMLTVAVIFCMICVPVLADEAATTTIYGKFQLNETIVTNATSITQDINFTCGGVKCVSFSYYNDGTPTIELKTEDGSYIYPYNGAWGSPEYIEFDFGDTEQIVSVEFYNFITGNVKEFITEDHSLYTWIESLWPYIFPADVIEANANLIALFTMAAVALVVFAPLFIIFIGITGKLVSSFFGRR